MMTILYATLTVLLLGLVAGAILGCMAVLFRVDGDPLVEQAIQILPRTQCGQCGYPGCRPYAEAMVNGDAINKCPPGGEVTVKKLAELLGSDLPQENPNAISDSIKRFAWIREESCIGCTKCIQVCPVDAIVGSIHKMHTVITNECTGCELCLIPCPTDCIEIRRPVCAIQN